ncbi:MAG: penicillin-binding protein [Bacteroidota bacterium]
MDQRKDILWRVYLVYFSVCLLGLIIIGKAIHIQFVEGDYWKKRADSLTLSYINIEAIRGDILSSDGSLLATSVPNYEIRMDMMADALTDEIFDKKVDSLGLSLANYFKDKSASEYSKLLKRGRIKEERYLLIRKNVSYKDLLALQRFPIFKMGRNRGGLIVELDTKKRIRPYSFLASRTIGFERTYQIKKGNKTIDTTIFVGIEGAYDTILKGIGGKRLMRRIAGNVYMPVNDENVVEPQNGCDVVTTIDINIQDVAENALMKRLKEHNASHGCVILMEVATGDIKAIANLTRTKDGTYSEQYNYAIGESIEPGSTFKLASVLAAMDDGLVNLNTPVNTGNGIWEYKGQKMEDSHSGGFGTISLLKAFEVSSNVGISKTIVNCYGSNPQRFINKLYKMGLNNKLGIEIPGEGKPDIKSVSNKYWSPVSLPWMSIGYELRLTPMQVLTFYNAVANNGTMVKPKFVKEIRYAGKVRKTFPTVVLIQRICSLNALRMARIMLEGVVQDGTAKNLKDPHIRIAGKTGTAQIAKGNKGYGNEEGNTNITYRASFVGYFPAENPQFTCIVVVNAPSNEVYYGNLVAGPIFKEIAEKVYSTQLELHDELKPGKPARLPFANAGSSSALKNIYSVLGFSASLPGSNLGYVAPVYKDSTLYFLNRSVSGNQIPNVIGMGMQEALYLMESIGLKVIVKGKGRVTKQSVPAGSRIVKGTEVILELS